ncbi:AHH domain-containing protein [Myxococcaceae bacterium GXIMD 01537]
MATDKNEVSATRGGPWTPRFEDFFAKAGMRLDDPTNRIYLRGHRGPHPEAYHKEVHDRLQTALFRCPNRDQCRRKLVEALRQIASEVCTSGSLLHRLLTNG